MPDVFPDRFSRVTFGQCELVCFHQNGVDKIVLTQELLPRVVKYYHEVIAHVKGAARLSQTIRQHLWHRDIDKECKRLIGECLTCMQMKRGNKTYGKASPQDAFVNK